jgi:hypothetical protein
MDKVNNPQKQYTGESEKQKETILSYLALKNDQALQELQAQIHSYQIEIEALKAEINVLEHSADQPDQFLAFASTQSKKTSQGITESIDHEFAGIEEEGRRINERHKQKIMDLDAKMQQGIQYAYKLMNDMLEKSNQQKPAAPVKPSTPNPVENSNYITKEAVQEEKTPTQEIKNVTIKETVRQETLPDDATSRVETKQQVRQDVQPVIQPNNIDMRQPVFQDIAPVGKAGNVKIIEGFWEEPRQKEEKPKMKPETAGTSDVTGLKNMYVIGKIAGDDLFDRSGKLIIAKNEIITQDVIEKAEREGNLIELVLEMKLQEG